MFPNASVLISTTINFDNFSFVITRKGGKEAEIYFGDEVAEALSDYLDYRKAHPPVDENDKALFLSNRGKRISVRQVELMVKKYAQTAVKTKKSLLISFSVRSEQSLSGNRRYISCCRRTWSCRCQHDKKTLYRHGSRTETKSRKKNQFKKGLILCTII